MDTNVGKTFYKDIPVKSVWNNFKIKHAKWIWVRFFFIGFFGMLFKMFVRANRSYRDPETAKINWKTFSLVWGSVLFILVIVVVGTVLAVWATQLSGDEDV